MEQNTRSLKPLYLIAGIVAATLGGIGGSAVVTLAFEAARGGRSADATLMAVASEMNAGLPMMVDGFTRWDSTAAAEPGRLIYRYTIMNLPDGVEAASLKDELRRSSGANYRTNPEMSWYRDNNITLQYQYFDEAGEFIMDFEIDPSEFDEN